MDPLPSKAISSVPELASGTPFAGLLDQASLGAVARQQLGLGLGDVRELTFESFGNASMKRASWLPQQSPVSRILYEGVLEQVGYVRRHALPK